MSMTRKHFVAIAEAISDERRHHDTVEAQIAIDNVVAALSVEFRRFNSNFDAVRFDEATRKSLHEVAQ